MGSCGNYLEEGRRQKSGYSESKRKDDNERLNCDNDFISQSRMVLPYDFTKPNCTFGCGSVLVYLGYECALFLLLYTASLNSSDITSEERASHGRQLCPNHRNR